MIKTEKNQNFSGFFNVFAFGKLIEQVQGRIKANALAMKIAKENNQTHFQNHRQEMIKVSWPLTIKKNNMTRKHFEAVAQSINLSFRNAPNEQAEIILSTLASNLAYEFELANPRFNRSKFLAVALA